MATRQELNSEKTKQSILAAANRLFAEKGYNGVSMREIAKEAKCSHTTIYIYFKDKDALLYELSIPPLLDLKKKLEHALHHPSLSPDGKLKTISQEVIRFCLSNRSMYAIFFGVKAGRVDEKEPELEINKIRNELFGILSRALMACLPLSEDDERLLIYSRIFFFHLHGIVGTYAHSNETLDSLLRRMSETFDEAMEVILCGMLCKIEEGDRMP